MTVVHIVIFKFPSSAPEAAKKKALDDVAALKDTCIHPITNLPYIKSLKAGKVNRNEGIQRGFTHLFVMEFENTEDRDYYVSKDPAHQRYIKALDELPIDEIQVLDFTEGVY